MSLKTDFFHKQRSASRTVYILTPYFLAAILLSILVVYAAISLCLQPVEAICNFWLELYASEKSAVFEFWDLRRFAWISGITSAVILAASLQRMRQSAKGGRFTAFLLGGELVSPSSTEPRRRQLLNVVEEMAIASGCPVPDVFMLKHQNSINGFTAGFTPADAVIGVTRGAVGTLTRNELQAVAGHCFSDILNGDMRLNTVLAGLFHGLQFVGLLMKKAMGTTLRGAIISILLLPVAVPALTVLLLARMLKCAITRQRQYLADACSAQFTRNPAALVSALKKIGGFVMGSRIMADAAEQTSHMFFANPLPKGVFDVPALRTHPSPEKRIRRFDPGFDGQFEYVPSHLRVPPEETERRDSKPEKYESIRDRVAVPDPAALVSGIGMFGAVHLAYARKLLEHIPNGILAETRLQDRATLLVYALLLSSNPTVLDKQLEHLSQSGWTDRLENIRKLYRQLRSVPAEGRMPLVELSLPALKGLPAGDKTDFMKNIEHLVVADERVDFFEFALYRILQKHLAPAAGKQAEQQVKHKTLTPLTDACGKLLSCLAWRGARAAGDETNSYLKGIKELKPSEMPGMLSRSDSNVAEFAEALDAVSEAAPGIKRKIIKACVACVAADGYLSAEEADVLRAVSACLDCPMPPVLPI